MNRLTPILLSALALAACQERAHAQPQQPLVLSEAMKTVVAPQSQILWDVSAKAINDAGDPDGAKLTAAEWTQLEAAGAALARQSEAIAAAPAMIVAPPGGKIQDEGNPESSTAAQVEGFIAADRQGFADMARTLALSATEFAAAAKGHDAKRLAAASDGLDAVCEGCHLKYWYPQQKP